MCPALAMTSLSPKSLNPQAESWIPEAKKPSTISFDQDPSPEPKKSLDNNLMFPHEIYTLPSSPSLALAVSQHSAILENFQQPHYYRPPPPPPRPITYYFYQASFEQSFLTWNFNGVWSYYNLGSQPQPTIPLGIRGTPFSKLGCAAVEVDSENLKEVMDENVTEEKTDSEVSCGEEGHWKDSRRFLPPRFRRSRSLEYQGRKETCRKVWKPRKSKSDDGDGVTAASGCGVVSLSPHPSPSPPSPKEAYPFCNYTTVMIRNIPNQYRRDNLMRFLDSYCKNYNLEYDFLYLPMDFWRKDNLGYAFVNFTSAAGATKIKNLLQGFKWYGNQLQESTIFSKKICEMTWAKIQGKDALVSHFQNSNFACDNIEYLPVVLSPPRNGSETMILPKTIGNLKGLTKSPRPMKKFRKCFNLHCYLGICEVRFRKVGKAEMDHSGKQLD